MITRTIIQTVFIILYLVTLGTGDFSRYQKEMEVLSLTLGVLLTTNGVIMSVTFFFRYRAKIKYAIAKRKLLKLLFRQCFPYGLLATLLLIPVSISFFVTRLIMVNAYTFDTLVYYLVRQFLRFLWTFSICYAMYLVNLGSQHINPMSYDGDNKLDDAVEIVSAFRHDREQRSIVEMFLRQVFHRFGGGVQGYILNYTNEGEQRISPVCKFTLTEKGEIVNITFISNDTFLSPTDLALPLVHSAIARKETFLMSFDDCLEDEEIRSKCDVSRFRTGGGSVVCVPIMDQEILSSVVYFESTKDVLIDTISPVDLYILELLSQQLNISLDNSRLFADLTTMNRSLDRKVEERTRELKQQKVELEEAKCKAEASAQSKLIFLANMSHEVRTPASQILSSAEVLSKTSLTGEQSEYLNIIQSSGKLLLHILNDILDISKLNSQKLKLEFAEFNMHQAIKSTIGAFSVSKPVSVAYFIDESLPQIAVGDVTRIQQIFTNLVSNAVKFTDVGYVLLSTHAVLVESAQDQNIFDITFSVSDSGTGISPENVNLIFDRFEQENTSISRTRGGTGLGLAIASDLCRLMGSKLRVETSLGSGSKFYFTLRLPCPKNPTISPRIRHISRLNKSVLLLSNSTVCVRDTNKTIIRLQLQHFGLNITRKFWPFENDTTRKLRLDAIVFDACSIPNEQIKDAIWRVQSFGYPFLVIYSQDQSRYFTNASYPTLQHPYKQRCLKYFLHQILDGGKDIIMSDNERIAPPPSLPEIPQNLSILLAEDNIVNQKVLSAMFKKMGYKIDIAENGQIALDLVKSSTYDIVFMDVRFVYISIR
ncbi:hypothetical protein BKA69DRAFT_1089969 [Paraphysoderma sedebokerense]|nr:hypothetical protein BKA69DRAFT_1089969 [Paraphysoderma sedebokerense]